MGLEEIGIYLLIVGYGVALAAVLLLYVYVKKTFKKNEE